MVTQGPKSIPSLFWRSQETGDLRCNTRFAPVFSTEKKFNGSTFLRFVKILLELSDKAAIAMDAAFQHRTKAFKEFVKENSRRLQIMYLPTGCHELSAIEECRRQLKTQSSMYEYHEHVSGRARATMKYLRVAVCSQNIEQYLFRKLIAKTF